MSTVHTIVGFCCEKAISKEKELAGVPSSIHAAVRVSIIPCSSKTDVLALIKAFEAGADAVFVLACRAEDCALVEGCRRAHKVVHETRKMLDEIGLGGKRLEIFQLGSHECQTSVQAADVMIARLKEME